MSGHYSSYDATWATSVKGIGGDKDYQHSADSSQFSQPLKKKVAFTWPINLHKTCAAVGQIYIHRCVLSWIPIISVNDQGGFNSP